SRQSSRSLSNYEISNEDTINFISMSRLVEEGVGTSTGSDSLLRIFLTLKRMNIDRYTAHNKSILRVRIGDEVFRSTFSKQHKNSSRILAKFAKDKD
ncbi:11006_t:CDS:2, partial [Scutellospora calospora]